MDSQRDFSKKPVFCKEHAGIVNIKLYTHFTSTMNQMVRRNHLDLIKKLSLMHIYECNADSIANLILKQVSSIQQTKKNILATEMYSELCDFIYHEASSIYKVGPSADWF